ncbi:MAG TPA: diguanylate cyclase [Allocoleopsis sp.]
MNSERKPLILVVDDERTMRLLLRLALEQDGYEVIEGQNGEQGLLLYQSYQPDLILLDALMPVMDGFICCEKLQQLSRDNNHNLSILMITILDDSESVEQAFNVGAIDYITKPINWSVLSQRVKRIINQSIQSKQIRQLLEKLERSNEELKNLTYIDSLTKLANRRKFEEYLHQEWKRMIREQGYLSLILVDIDAFEDYNYIFGDRAGEQCLQTLANAISNQVKRPADLLARYRESVFSIILPQTELEGAIYLAQLIQTAVKELEIRHNHNPTGYITVSCGISSINPQLESNQDLLMIEAYQRIAIARSQGCNQIISNG